MCFLPILKNHRQTQNVNLHTDTSHSSRREVSNIEKLICNCRPLAQSSLKMCAHIWGTQNAFFISPKELNKLQFCSSHSCRDPRFSCLRELLALPGNANKRNTYTRLRPLIPVLHHLVVNGHFWHKGHLLTSD